MRQQRKGTGQNCLKLFLDKYFSHLLIDKLKEMCWHFWKNCDISQHQMNKTVSLFSGHQSSLQFSHQTSWWSCSQWWVSDSVVRARPSKLCLVSVPSPEATYTLDESVGQNFIPPIRSPAPFCAHKHRCQPITGQLAAPSHTCSVLNQ